MEQLPRLKARIANLHELRDLFRALRVLAASHVQEAQGALQGIRKYVEVIEHSIAEAAGLLDRLSAAAPQGPGRSVLLVVCSEHGFAGAFNERLLERAAAVREAGQELFVVGSRGAALAAESGFAVDGSLAMATHAEGVLTTARRAAGRLAGANRVDAVYGSYLRGGSFQEQTQQLLPLDPALLQAAAPRSPPLHHLAPEILLQRLADEYLFAEITRAIMESFASENAARLRVMEAADHSIGEKLETLHRRENTLRQDAITEELIDVVTGSEAILAARAK